MYFNSGRCVRPSIRSITIDVTEFPNLEFVCSSSLNVYANVVEVLDVSYIEQ